MRARLLVLFVAALLPAGPSVALAGHDVGATMVLSPNGDMYGRGPFYPWIAIYNYGTEMERDFPVWCWIDSAGTRVYEGSAPEDVYLWPQHEHWIDGFPLWYPTPGYYSCSVTAFTALPGDENPANDTVHANCTLILARYADQLVSELGGAGPVMDGLISPDEWHCPESEISDTAGRAGVTRPHASCLVCVTHTGETAYIAVDAIAARTRGDSDRVVIKFDEDDDGVWATDSSEGTYTAFVSNGLDSLVYSWLPGQQCPGCTSASSVASGNLQIEVAIPIGPGRTDLGIDPIDDLSGCAISYWRGDSCYGWWPQSLELAQWDDPSYFGDYWWVASAVAGETCADPVSPAATVVRGALRMECRTRDTGYRAELLDVTGRRVMDLAPGDNDVSGLAPGVYFVRGEGSRVPGFEGARTRKVIVAD